MNLETKHYIAFGSMLVSLGVLFNGLEHGWADATSPTFIGGVFMLIGTTIGSIFVGAPKKKWDGKERRG